MAAKKDGAASAEVYAAKREKKEKQQRRWKAKAEKAIAAGRPLGYSEIAGKMDVSVSTARRKMEEAEGKDLIARVSGREDVADDGTAKWTYADVQIVFNSHSNEVEQPIPTGGDVSNAATDDQRGFPALPGESEHQRFCRLYGMPEWRWISEGSGSDGPVRYPYDED